MLRTIAGILVGLAIAVALVFGAEGIVQMISPAPANFDMHDPEAVRARVASLPMTAILLVLVGWLVGTGLGSWAAARIARNGATWPGLVVGAAILAATVYNLFTIPHPIWFAATAVIGIPVASWLGARGGRAGPAVAA